MSVLLSWLNKNKRGRFLSFPKEMTRNVACFLSFLECIFLDYFMYSLHAVLSMLLFCTLFHHSKNVGQLQFSFLQVFLSTQFFSLFLSFSLETFLQTKESKPCKKSTRCILIGETDEAVCCCSCIAACAR